MRFHEFNEAIENRPRNLQLFLTNRVKDLTQVDTGLKQAIALIKEHERDGERMLRSWINYTQDEDAYEDMNAAFSVANTYRLERDMPTGHLIQSIDNYLKYGKDFWKYIVSCFTYMEPIPELSNFEHAELGAVEYGYQNDDHENLKDEEYVAAMGLLQGFRLLKVSIDRGRKVCDLLKAKLTIVDNIVNSYTGKYRPEHGEIEILYHASAFCKEILEHGFVAERPLERKGLGNFGEQSEISFTHDLEIARNIMRCLKDVWAIAHGQITKNTIIGWAKSEGILDLLARQHGGKVGFDWVQTPEDIAMLYSYWVAHSKIRTNPVFIGIQRLVGMMYDKQQNDIGVLACEVKLEQADEYRIGESEFRLSADRVISIKRKL